MRQLVKTGSYLSAAALLVLGTATEAAIYKSVDASGTIGYSDNASADAKRIELPPLNVVGVEEFSSQSSPASDSGPVATTIYYSFSIIHPENRESARSNDGSLSVEFDISPELEPDHAIALHLDGEPVFGETGEIKLLLANVDRGTHSLQGFILADG